MFVVFIGIIPLFFTDAYVTMEIFEFYYTQLVIFSSNLGSWKKPKIWKIYTNYYVGPSFLLRSIMLLLLLVLHLLQILTHDTSSPPFWCFPEVGLSWRFTKWSNWHCFWSCISHTRLHWANFWRWRHILWRKTKWWFCKMQLFLYSMFIHPFSHLNSTKAGKQWVSAFRNSTKVVCLYTTRPDWPVLVFVIHL